MKKLVLIGSLLAPLTTFASDFYLGGNVALGSSDRSLFGDSASAIVGYDMNLNHEFSLGIEAEYRDFGDESYWFSWSGNRGNKVRAKSMGINLKPTYYFGLDNRQLYLSGIIGMHEYKEKWKISDEDGAISHETHRDIDLTWGGELGARLTNRLALNAGFKRSRPSLKDGRVAYKQFFFGMNFYL